MPHTSHKRKKQQSKRIEVLDEDGWTRVTTNNDSFRRPRPLSAQMSLEHRFEGSTVTYPKLELPAGKTVQQVKDQYDKIEKRWLESQACKELENCLAVAVEENIIKSVDKCLLFGSGTFSGVSRGWIDRSHVAMYQLAAYLSVIKAIEKMKGSRPTCIAQEPIYTHLDIEFLSLIGVDVVETPAGYAEITTNSFVYTPNAELEVTLRTLVRNAAMQMMNGKLDMYWRNEKDEACTDSTYICVRPDSKSERIRLSDKNGVCSEKGWSQQDDKLNQASDGGATLDSRAWKPLHECTEGERKDYVGTIELEDEIEEGLKICEEFKGDKEVRRLPALDAKDEPFYNVHFFFRRVHDTFGP